MSRIGIDLESTMDHKKIHLAKTIEIDTGEVKTWYEASPLRDYLEASTLIVAHGGVNFDFPMLKRLWNTKIPTTKMFDTIVASRLLDPSMEGGHSLKAWGERLGTKKVAYESIWEWMADRKQAYPGECYDAPFPALLDHYCEGDVLVLRELYLHLESELKRLKFSEQSVALEHRVASICANIEENGYALDRPQATMLVTEWKTKLSGIVERAEQLYPPVVYERYSETTGKRLKDGVRSFNIGARQQIAQKLMELGWEPEKHTEKGSIIVDEAVLDEILKECK